MDTAAFLRVVFGAKPAAAYVALFTLPNRRTLRYTDVGDAARYPPHLPGYDVYVGVGLQGRDPGQTHRGKELDITGIVGLWADVDIAGPGHQDGKVYAPTEAAARALVEGCGKRPTVLVHSGHGLQAWWLFARPWMFGDSAERARAKAASVDWQAGLREAAGREGWTIDATADLTRVLRLPGTVNHKLADAPAPVRVLD